MSTEKKITLRDTIVPKSDQLNYDDVMSTTITADVIGLAMGTPEQPVSIKLKNVDRPYKPNKSMRRVLIAIWGDEGRKWIGQRMRIRGNPEVKWGGQPVGGIEVAAMSGISVPTAVKLTISRGKRVDYIVQPLKKTDDSQPENADTVNPNDESLV
jgi:hypothetical protein